MKVTVTPIATRPGGLENKKKKKKRGDHPNYSLIKIGQNTKKSPGDLRRITVTQTPVKISSAKTAVKNFPRSINNNKRQRKFS